MSKSFPLNVKSSRPGPKPKAGERYPSGDLKPPGPAPEALAQREAMRADPTRMGNPIDAAFVGGWLDIADYRAALTYASLYRRTSPGCGPRLASLALPEADAALNELRGRRLSQAEIAQLWDEIVGEAAGETPEEVERRRELASAQWRLVNAAMTPNSRAEVFLVCVREAWPQWIVQRSAGEALRAKAVAEKRALTDDELAYIARKFATAWERKRDLLVAGLRAIARTLADLSPRKDEREVRQRPAPAPPIGTRVIEEITCVDENGALVRIVERRASRLR